MIKLVVFDLDGTLADTLRDLAQAMNYALRGEGLTGYEVERYRAFVGNGVDNLVKVTMADAYTPEGAIRVKEAFQAYYADHCQDCTDVYDGIEDLLDRLTARKTATAVISNKPHRFVPGILKKLYPRHDFWYVSGQQEGIARKPAPDALEKLIALSGYDKSEVLYVGDSDVDVIFAHNAGIKVCGVSWGFRGAEELRRAGADVIVDSAEELYREILKKNRLDKDE